MLVEFPPVSCRLRDAGFEFNVGGTHWGRQLLDPYRGTGQFGRSFVMPAGSENSRASHDSRLTTIPESFVRAADNRLRFVPGTPLPRCRRHRRTLPFGYDLGVARCRRRATSPGKVLWRADNVAHGDSSSSTWLANRHGFWSVLAATRACLTRMSTCKQLSAEFRRSLP